jgi:type II secretory pathway pseudopilin PulG
MLQDNMKIEPTIDHSKNEVGFTLLETVIAMLIITVGLMAILGAMVYALSVTGLAKNTTNTKFKITSILEQIEMLRNTKELTFKQIANTGAVDNTNAENPFSGFVTGWQSVSKEPGPDGIYGTCDDLLSSVPNRNNPCDGTLDNSRIIEGYRRQIVITDLTDHLKKVEVTLEFPGINGKKQELVGVSYVNNDARSNYRR